MIEQELYNHLKTEVPLVSGRVFANVAHQDTAKPALVYLMEKEVILSAGCDNNYREWSVHLYGEEYLPLKDVKEETAKAIQSFSHTAKDIAAHDHFDDESGLFVQLITFYTGKRRT